MHELKIRVQATGQLLEFTSFSKSILITEAISFLYLRKTEHG